MSDDVQQMDIEPNSHLDVARLSKNGAIVGLQTELFEKWHDSVEDLRA